MQELHSTISRGPRPSVRDIPSSSKVQSKGNGLQHKPKIVNEAKRKAETLKDNRDYSFLLSDDSDLSSSPKEKPAARSSLTQKADRGVMHSAVKSKAPTSHPARLSNGYKNTLSTQRHAEGKVDSMRKEAFSNRERVVSRDNERMHSIVRNGSNQANTGKTTSQKLPSKGPIANKHVSKDVNDPSQRKSSVASRQHLSEIERPQSSQSQRIQSAGQRPQHSSHGQRPHQSGQQRPQQSLQNRKPQQVPQGQSSQQSLQTQKVATVIADSKVATVVAESKAATVVAESKAATILACSEITILTDPQITVAKLQGSAFARAKISFFAGSMF